MNPCNIMREKINNKTKSIVDKVKKLYETEKNISIIAKNLQTNRAVIKRCLIYSGIEWKPIIELGIIKSKKKKYTFIERYFDFIDTEEKAYWLGFLAADGYVNEKRGYTSILLSKDDEPHLIKFKKCLQSNHIIKNSTSKRGETIFHYSKLTIYSKFLTQDLVKNNIVQRKSLILQPPENLDENLKIHFMRGFFDGDGGISFHKVSNRKNTLQASLSITSTKEMLLYIESYIKKELNVNSITYQRYNNDKNNYTLMFSGNINVIRICELLYRNSNIFLDRKYERFQKLKEDYNSKRKCKQMNVYCDERSSQYTWYYDFCFKKQRYTVRGFLSKQDAIDACCKRMKEVEYPENKFRRFLWANS